MAVKTGMMVDERGTPAHFPAWPFADSTNGAVAKAASEVRQLLDHAAFYDRQNQLVYNAATARLAKGTDALLDPAPLLPNNDARRSEATRRQQQLAASKSRLRAAQKVLANRKSQADHATATGRRLTLDRR